MKFKKAFISHSNIVPNNEQIKVLDLKLDQKQI